jgi:hypothetical protein
MPASRRDSVGPHLHTMFMAHEMLTQVLEAQRANATLSGDLLRRAAAELPGGQSRCRTIYAAFDAAGERILGAALVLPDQSLEAFDATQPFPRDARCVLVGGFVAGPVGLADAAASVLRAGAVSVDAAILGGLVHAVANVGRIRLIGHATAHVA